MGSVQGPDPSYSWEPRLCRWYHLWAGDNDVSGPLGPRRLQVGDGSTRSLKVAVTRDDETGERAARSSPAACTTSAGQRDGSKKADCDAAATLDHPEGETAHHRGEATWEWNDGRHRVAFDTTSTTTSESVSCDDEPARPSGGERI